MWRWDHRSRLGCHKGIYCETNASVEEALWQTSSKAAMTYLSPHGLGWLVQYLPASPTCLPAFFFFLRCFKVLKQKAVLINLISYCYVFVSTESCSPISRSFFPLRLISAPICCGLIFAGVKTSLSSSLLRHQRRTSDATILPAAGVRHPPIPHTERKQAGRRRREEGSDGGRRVCRPPPVASSWLWLVSTQSRLMQLSGWLPEGSRILLLESCQNR